MKIYIDGKYYDKENAKISVFDHGFLYGDGVFEGIRIYNSKIFKLEEHIDRLYDSAKAIFLEINQSKEEMTKLLNESVKINNKTNGYIRLVISRGDGPLGLDPFQCEKSKTVIIVSDIQLYPKEFYENGIEIISSSYRRIPSESFDPRIKSLNYLNNIMAKVEARKNNFFEAILYNTKGFVAECTGDNIFLVKKNELFTPSKSDGALEGITRNCVIDLAKNKSIKVNEVNLTRFDLYSADECFLTGTGAENMPVTKIDGRVIGAGNCGALTKLLIDEYQNLVMK